MSGQGRSVVFLSRYAQWKHKEYERRRREALGGSGGMLPQKIFNFRASEMPFPMFFRGIFINRNMKKRSLFSNFVVVHTLWQPLNSAREASRSAHFACQTFLLARSRYGAFSQASYNVNTSKGRDL